MRVGILTWHQANNHGAILQAYATCSIIRELGYDPVFLEYYWDLYDNGFVPNKEKTKVVNIERVLRKINTISFDKKKQKIFNEFRMTLPIGKRYDEENNLAAVLIGSDMVFDIIEGYNPYMYGKGINSQYIFSYAASFGYTTQDLLDQSGKMEEIYKLLNELKAIGVRDLKTEELIRYIGIDRTLSMNIDPVLCYGFAEEIERWDTKILADQKYILIYAYHGNMNDEATISEIRTIAKKEGLDIISVGYYHRWCDKCINASPKLFIEYFKYARYIITDTFHGTVFSALLHKNFVTIIRRNGFKTQYLLESAGLDTRIVNNAEELDSKMHNQIDFTEYDSWLFENRKLSLNYIKENLDKARISFAG